jgi:hypothetical protein
MRTILAVASVVGMLFAFPAVSLAKDMPYRSSVTVKVGQTVLLKGIRHKDCGKPARAFSYYKPQLPKSSLGTFSDGGVGTTRSDRCGGVVPARGVRFTAKKPGKERLRVMGDPITITVK